MEKSASALRIWKNLETNRETFVCSQAINRHICLRAQPLPIIHRVAAGTQLPADNIFKLLLILPFKNLSISICRESPT